MLSEGDVIDFTIALLFPFFLWLFTFAVGRLSERLFPAPRPDEDESDAEDYIA